jgi:hypothetical protein
MDYDSSLKTGEQCVSDKTNIPSEPYIASPPNKLRIKYQGQKHRSDSDDGYRNGP